MPHYLIARPRGGLKALAELVLLVAFFVTLEVAGVLILGAIDPGSAEGAATAHAAGIFDTFVIAIALPAAFLAARASGRDPAGLISVERKIRWPLVWRALAVAVPVYAVVIAIDAADGGLTFSASTLATAAAFLFSVPVQAACEETIFRAALPQIVGNWVRSPWVAYGLAAIPFVALHTYNWVGLTDVLVICLCVSYLTWRSGGIEQAVVVHACSNLSVFLMQALRPNEVVTTDITWAEGLATALITVAATAGVAVVGAKAGVAKQKP